MPVNPSSVIPTWINSYYPSFYVSITDKENFAYTNIPADKTYWIALFTNLSIAMGSWKNINRQTSVSGLISSIFNYTNLYLNFAESPSLMPTLDGYVIFDMNSFITSTLSRPTNYYNDLAETPPLSGIYTSAKMTADINAVGNISVENGKIVAAQNSIEGITLPFVNKAIFEDVIPTGPLAAVEITSTGSGYVDGEYFNVPLTTVSGTGSGAQASKLVVSNGEVLLCLTQTVRGALYTKGTVVTALLPEGTGFQATVVASIGSGKQGIGEYIFNTLNYKKVYQNLNVGGLTPPSYIT